MRALMWFRSDLRARDNSALWAACRDAEEVVGLFVVSANEWRGHDVAPVRVRLMLRCLEALDGSLAKAGIPLLVVAAERAKEVPGLVVEMARRHQCGQIHWNIEYEVDEARRDERTAAMARETGLAPFAHHDQAIVRPGVLRTGEGRPYTVFTPFKNAWVRRMKENGLPEVRGAAKAKRVCDVKGAGLPRSVEGFETSVPEELWPGGETAAHERLKRFIGKHIAAYKTARDLPAEEGTSALSPYLSVGAISARECLAAAAKEGGGLEADSGAATWISELVWRDFYIHILEAFPRVCMGRAFQPATERLKWRYSETDLTAWKQGRTGVPIVDAGIRQLLTTGWMHNRVRMITAMFLSKNLLIDWREGERHFMRQLVDGFVASNNGGWQWAASTGTDAAPYFRVFNPVSQSRKFDPRGEYIRRYVPELAGLDDEAIHAPWELPESARAGLDYPKPIVDLKSSRERAIAAFKDLKA